jgi:hypothetical protein
LIVNLIEKRKENYSLEHCFQKVKLSEDEVEQRIKNIYTKVLKSNMLIDDLFLKSEDPTHVCKYLLEKTYDGLKNENKNFINFTINALI